MDQKVDRMTRQIKDFTTRAIYAALLGMIAFWAGIAGWWTIQRDPPIRIDAIEVLTDQVMRGHEIRVSYTVDRRDLCEVIVERFIIDSDRVIHLIEPRRYSSGRGSLGMDQYVERSPVPIGASYGPAVLREILIHTCNPVHRFWPIRQPLPEVAFEIIPASP